MNLFLDLTPELVGHFWDIIRVLDRIEKIRREENERKNMVIKSLLTEIADIKSILEKGLTGKKVGHPGVIMEYLEEVLLADAFDSIVYSGSYQMLDIKTQRALTWLYPICKQMNELTAQLSTSFIRWLIE